MAEAEAEDREAEAGVAEAAATTSPYRSIDRSSDKSRRNETTSTQWTERERKKEKKRKRQGRVLDTEVPSSVAYKRSHYPWNLNSKGNESKDVKSARKTIDIGCRPEREQ